MPLDCITLLQGKIVLPFMKLSIETVGGESISGRVRKFEKVDGQSREV
jgi:hypothetical protein